LGELLVVADGIGGLEGGATASRIVTETFCEHLLSLAPDYPAGAAIREASARANARILAAAADPASPHNRMGSTVVLALIQQPFEQPAQPDAPATRAGTRVWIGHIGDSRAYLLRDGRLSRLTKDHSAVQDLIDQNRITPEEAGNHPDASVLTRSLGHLPHVDIDVDLVPLAPGDSLLLCSDGLWGFVPEQEIQTVMADAHLPVEATAKTLLEMALAAGGHDNIGIELARAGLLPAPLPETMPEPVEGPEPTGARDSLKPDQPLDPIDPPDEQQLLPAEKPRKLGFIGILLLCLLAGAAMGAILYFVLHGDLI
jgi:protein phosphatase